MDPDTRLAAPYRDSHLALRRVERQQALIECLHAAHGERIRLAELARTFGVSVRTLARDVERLADSGVPIASHPGRGGGVDLPRSRTSIVVSLDLPEAAAVMSSLAVLGPSVSPSAAAVLRKLAAALHADDSEVAVR